MSSPSDQQPGPAYGQEGAYVAYPDQPADRTAPPPPQPAPGASPLYGTPPPDAPYAPYAPYAQGAYVRGGHPPAGSYAPPALPRNDLAVWSLVLGLLGVLGCLFFTGIPAVVVGGNARRAVAAGQADNEGMATAGIVLGWVSTGLGALLVLLFVVMAVLPLLFFGLASG